jgi:hypothetical protein
MVHAIALDPAEFGPTAPTALTERSRQSTQLDSGPGPTDEVQDLLLIQMRYDEYVARDDLQRLFESGQLACLGG